jgi:hypothetical protein
MVRKGVWMSWVKWWWIVKIRLVKSGGMLWVNSEFHPLSTEDNMPMHRASLNQGVQWPCPKQGTSSRVLLANISRSSVKQLKNCLPHPWAPTPNIATLQLVSGILPSIVWFVSFLLFIFHLFLLRPLWPRPTPPPPSNEQARVHL